jgi:hypothetical protein
VRQPCLPPPASAKSAKVLRQIRFRRRGQAARLRSSSCADSLKWGYDLRFSRAFRGICLPLAANPFWEMAVDKSRGLHILLGAIFAALGLSARPASPDAKLRVVSRADLCVTEGTIDDLPGQGLGVSVPKMRAYVNAPTPPLVEAHFTYLGSTGNEARLGSGELRRQFGLKLRAEDACNLVYAMWRIEPESKLVVSVKNNPGQHSSAECGNRGYRNIKPRRSTPVPVLRPGATHTLRAEMNGDEMKVFADNTMVWEGSVGPEAVRFEGPVGIRSDNARLQIELRAGLPLKAQSGSAPGCRSGPGESE